VRDFRVRVEPLLFQFEELIERGEYFSAHEVLEEEWRRSSKGSLERKLLQGLINGAVALELKRRGRGSWERIWRVYLNYSGGFPDWPQLKRVCQLLEERVGRE
jgi:hypothetical protein